MRRTSFKAVSPATVYVLVTLLCSLFVFSLAGICSAAVVWEEDFESGWGAWTADNGVWQVDMPCASPGPGGPHGGLNCAGTNLCGNYPYNTDSRLISPIITLPSVTTGQELWLRFWEWFSYEGGDWAYVQISVQQPDGTWAAPVSLSNYPGHYTSSTWSWRGVELTPYAGKVVRIAFYHTSDGGNGTGPGWYVDDLTIEKYAPALSSPESFESGWDGWSTDNGIWQIGAPTSGPGGAHTGSSCAATVLNGNYPYNTDSRLISPTIALPSVSGSQELWLRFWMWYSYGGGSDQGQVQISVRQPDGSWGAWTMLATSCYWNRSSIWSPCGIELTAYAGETVRIAFYHYADGGSGNGPGWYVDDLTIEKYVPALANPESFESGWDGWSTDCGIWEIGAPTSGPGGAHTGSSCAATVLGGDYPYNTASRLVSPTIPLPAIASGEELWFSYWQWFSYGGGDYGQVELYDRPPGGVWSGPTVLSTVSGGSGGWSRSTLEVSAYAGREIKIAFIHWADGGSGNGPGWYIDDVKVYVPLANTVPLARQYPDGDRAAIPDVVVSAVWPSYFYVQDAAEHPSCGLRIQWSGGGVNVGDRVNVAGPMGTRSEGERYMGATSATVVGSVPAVVPIGVPCRSVGGGDWCYDPRTGAGQMGVAAGLGLNNVGLLIKTWGKVAEIGSGYFYMDDGWAMSSPSRRVKVLGDLPPGTAVGQAVQVTGASSCDSILFDHFAAAPLNTQLWTAVKGTPTFASSYLTLTSTGPGAGVDVRSKDLFEGISMEVKAKSTGWKVDTSFGFEFWEATTHYGIVVTNGHLGIINQSKSAPNEVYIPIPNWASLKGLDLIYALRWKSDRVVLDIKDHPEATVSYTGDLIPNRPLAIRVNASNDLADQLSVDYVRVVPQRMIRTRDEADIVPINREP